MTLAFSTKSGMWTTEYSFEPTCYARTDGRMVGFKHLAQTGPLRDKKFWLHDESDQRNRFYTQKFPSRISVVSNENPSATKAYESVSLETTYNDWVMNVNTQEQEGFVDSFGEKESDQYADVPKDIKITNANLTYIGTCLGSSLTLDRLRGRSIQMTSLSGRFAIGTLCFRNKAASVAGVFPDAQNGAVACINQNAERLGIIDTSQSQQENFVQVNGLSGNSLLIGNVPDSVPFDPAEADDGQFYTRRTQVELWVASPGSGESMKGDYLVVDVETPPGPENFELYAINVDQHKVRLDHSLGQNN